MPRSMTVEIQSESGLGRVCGLHYLVLIRVCDLSFEGFVKGRAVFWVLGRFMLVCCVFVPVKEYTDEPGFPGSRVVQVLLPRSLTSPGKPGVKLCSGFTASVSLICLANIC